jgi:hypothetical protein
MVRKLRHGSERRRLDATALRASGRKHAGRLAHERAALAGEGVG